MFSGLKLKKLQTGLLYLFAFFLPWQTCYIAREVFWQGAKWGYGTVCLYVSDLVLLALFGTYLLSAVRELIKRKHSFSWQRGSGRFWRGVFFVLFAGWLSLSLWWSPDKYLAFYVWSRLVSALGLWVVIKETRFSWKTLVIVLLFGALLQSGLGIYQFFTQRAAPQTYLGMSYHEPHDLGVSVVETSYRRYLRAYGGMPHPNILGGYLAGVLLLGIILYFSEREPDSLGALVKDILLLLSLGVVWTGLLLSFSRAAWIVFGLGLLFLLWRIGWRQKSWRWGKLILVCGAIGIVLVSLLGEAFAARFTLADREEVRSIRERIEYTYEARDLIAEHWWRGGGLGNYTYLLRQQLPFSRPGWYYQPVHNIFLLVWAELGLVGLVLWLGLLLVLLWPLRRRKFGFLAFLFLVFMLVDHWLWTSHFGTLYLFFSWVLLEKMP